MKKLIPILFSFLLLFTVLFGFMSIPVYAWNIDDVITWDDFPTSASSGSGDFFTFERVLGDNGEVAVESVNGSTKSLIFSSGGAGDSDDETHIDLDYDSSIDVTDIKFSFKFDFSGPHTNGNNGHYMQFNKDGVIQSNIRFYSWDIANINFFKIQVQDSNTTWIDLAYNFYNYLPDSTIIDMHMFINYSEGNNAYGDKLRYELFWTDNGTMMNATTVTMTEWQDDWEYIDEIIYYTDSNQGASGSGYDLRLWLGDIEFNQLGYSVANTNFPVEQWDYIGVLDWTGLAFTTPHYFLEEQRQVTMDVEIKAVDLLVDFSQYAQDSDVSHYQLLVNGEESDYHSCVAFIPYQGHYIMRWYNINVTCVDEKPTFEFLHGGEDISWYAGISESDIDDDDITGFKYHSNAWKLNGVYDGTHYGSHDLNYRFYFPFGENYEPPNEYNDTIDTDKNIYNQFDSVSLVWTISDILNVNYLVITSDGNEYYNNSVDGYTGFYVFVPTIAGDYNARIWCVGGNKSQCNFTVNALDVDHYLYTIPNPSSPNDNFDVFIKYNYAVHECVVWYTSCYDEETVKQKWIFDDIPIESKNFSLSISKERLWFFNLGYRVFNNETSSYDYTALLKKKHIVKDEYANTINCLYEVIDPDENKIQLLWGTHNYLGSDIHIRVNGVYLSTVDNECGLLYSEFNEIYNPVYSGDFKAELVIVMSDEIIILDTCYFHVSGDYFEPEEPEIPTEYENIFDSIPVWIKGIVGAIITLGFCFMPLVIVSGMEKINFKVDVPPVTYAISGGIGVTFCTIIGLFGMEIMFFICVIAGLSLVISYVWREKSD